MIRDTEHRWAEALRRIKDKGPEAWCEGARRVGGSVSRMFDRMVSEGLCTKAPHTITEKGVKWLADYERKPHARICQICKGSLGCVPLYHEGRVRYYHLTCFNKMRADIVARNRELRL